MDHHLNNLNPIQRQAIESRAAHLLIIAGPGTGKTHTLTHRIVSRAEPVPQGRKVLAITFTNKAAQEMRERLSQHIQDYEKSLFVGTFHQFCLLLLRQYYEHTDLKEDFVIIPPQEADVLARDIWPDKKHRDIKLLLQKISEYKAVRYLGTEPSYVGLYNAFLRHKNLLDFDDLLYEALKLLYDQPDVLSKVRAVYGDIFIDEYQDINRIQHELIKLLVGDEGHITAIGDPNQAIYGFRGSDVSFFESFAKDFAPAEVLSLSENYRSAKNLLLASGQIMAKTQGMPVAPLTAKIYEEGRLWVHESATDKAEAEFVVHNIEKLIGGASMFSQDSGRVTSDDEGEYGFSDIAVLYRLNSQRFSLKEAFDRLGIPYNVSGEEKECGHQEILDDVCWQGVAEADIEAQKVSLMSLHAAKGLEFSVVFIVGCEENLLPLDIEGLKGDVDEERRLFYVGMTRAKYRLVIPYVQENALITRMKECLKPR